MSANRINMRLFLLVISREVTSAIAELLARLFRSLSKWLSPLSKDDAQGRPVAQEQAPLSPILRKLGELDKATPGLGRAVGTLFLDDTSVRMSELTLALERGDAEAVAGIAHAIRGTAANVGAGTMAMASKSVEEFGRAGRLDKTRQPFNDLAAAFDEARDALMAAGMKAAA